MVLFLHLTAIAAYGAAWAIQVREFRVREAGPEGGGELLALALGAAAHLAGLALYSVSHGAAPLVGLGPASSSLALVIVLVVLGASIRPETRPAGLFLIPVALLLLVEASLAGIEAAPHRLAFRGPWFVFHVSAVFIGYGGLLLASTAGGMYLLQFRALKRKKFGSVFRFFPSLDTLDRLNRVGLVLGFPALTLGLVAGWSWTLTFGRGLALEDPEVIFGVVTWLAYLLAIFVRSGPRWQGERAAAASTAAFMVSLAAFLALRFTASRAGFFL